MNDRDEKIKKTLKTSIAVFSILSLFNFIGIVNSSYGLFSKSVDSKNSINIKTYQYNSCSKKICNFDSIGTEQLFVASNTGFYQLELWGGQGYDAIYGGAVSNHGNGAYTSAKIKLNKNTILYVYVGVAEIGGAKFNSLSDEAVGGASTDVRLTNGNWDDFNSLKSRIMVAAGGGAGAYNAAKCGNIRPHAGGLIGYTSNSISNYNNKQGGGATQTSGGAGGYAGYITGSNGKFGIPGVQNGAASGGNGYFGGGGAGHYGSGWLESGGGSSFISGHNGCVAITEDSTENNIKQRTDSNGRTCTDGTTDITCSYHYSGYKFTDTVMIDGAGYNWTTVKGDYVGQPQPDGTITTGHSGNGYAIITYLGK